MTVALGEVTVNDSDTLTLKGAVSVKLSEILKMEGTKTMEVKGVN